MVCSFLKITVLASPVPMNDVPAPLRPNDGTEPRDADLIARGVCRMLREMRFRTLTEFKLRSRRRADVIGLGRDGEVAIIEIKTSLACSRHV